MARRRGESVMIYVVSFIFFISRGGHVEIGLHNSRRFINRDATASEIVVQGWLNLNLAIYCLSTFYTVTGEASPDFEPCIHVNMS